MNVESKSVQDTFEAAGYKLLELTVNPLGSGRLTFGRAVAACRGKRIVVEATDEGISRVLGTLTDMAIKELAAHKPTLEQRLDQLARTYEKSVPYCGVQIERDLIEDAGRRIRRLLAGDEDFYEFLDLNAPLDNTLQEKRELDAREFAKDLKESK